MMLKIGPATGGVIIDNSVVSIEEELFDTICAGDSVLFDNTYLFNSGVYYATYEGVYGCDSNVILNLEVDTIDFSYDIVNPSCYGYSDGSITLYPSGGVEPYSFYWLGGGTDSIQTGLDDAGQFFTITDANGCSDSSWLFLYEPDSLIVTALLDSNAKCYLSNDGAVSAFAIGGTPGYSFAWNNAINLPNNINIPSGTYSVMVKDIDKRKIKSLLSQKDRSIQLIGHTDNVGSEAINQQLSLQRADTVKSYLVGIGYPPELIKTIGLGETQPVESNRTDEGRAKNRRVEIIY